MDIFQNQCSESLGFDSMLSSNHLNSPLHDSPGSPNPLSFAPSSPYFSSISQQLCGSSGTGTSTSGPNDVILPSIFVKIPTQINQQYQQESRLHNARSSNEIKCEERAEPIKSEVADTRLKPTATANLSERLPDIIDNYLNDTRATGTTVAEPTVAIRRCDYCPFASLSEAVLGEHNRIKHASGVRMLLDTTLNCPVCENKFYKKGVLELHLLEDHEMTVDEVEVVCSRLANFPQQPACSSGPVAAVSSSPQSNTTLSITNAATPAPNKSRIYIKDVQLLKNPDVIAQETQQHNMQQCPAQQLLPVEPQAILPPEETPPHEQFQSEQHHQPQTQSGTSNVTTASGSKIFIRNVSLLQNANFTPSAENILLSNGGKYHSFMNHECQSNSMSPAATAPAIGSGSMDDDSSYCQMLPSSVPTQPRSNRIYIKNVDILRNHPLLSLDTGQGASGAYNVPVESRASSCESIICTSTPPPSSTAQSNASQTIPTAALQPPATVIPLSQIISSQSQLTAMPNDQSLSGGVGIDDGVIELEGLMTVQQHQQQQQQHQHQQQHQQQQQHSQHIGQGPMGLPMMYATAPESSGLADNCTPCVSSNSSCISLLPVVNSPSTTSMHVPAHGYQEPSDGQRKSKIFIKNISVLKQPTIHLKSVDEVNLMTYDQLQLQNLLPVGVASAGAGMNAPGEQHLDGSHRHQEGQVAGCGESLDHQSFGERMDDSTVDHHQQPQQPEEAMDGYHDVGCYGDWDVCDFTAGYNEREDPGGGVDGGGAISVTSGGSNNNTLSMSCDGMLGEGRTDNFQPGFDQDDIILLPANCDGETQENEVQKMADSCWTSGELAGTTSNVQNIPAALTSSALALPEGTANGEDMIDDADGRNEETQLNCKDVLFGSAQEVINLDPPNEKPTVDEQMHVDESIVEGGPKLIGCDGEELSSTCTVPKERTADRPRPRGRPKGAKQTGITKLKKLYSNLTPQEEGYKCDHKDCGARFRQPDRLDYHRKCHLPAEAGGGGGVESSGTSSGTMQCPECGSIEFRNWNTLHTHLWREHGVDMELYACQLCSFKTPVLCRLTNTHMKIHSEERNFKCTICAKAFKNNKQLRNHRRSHRGDPGQQQDLQPSPDDAPSIIDDQPSAGERMIEVDRLPAEPARAAKSSKALALAGTGPLKCVKCGQKFTTQRQLRAHVDAKHPTTEGELLEGGAGGGVGGSGVLGKHRCVLCGMMFRTRYLLQSHSAKHSDEKRFKCEHCDYATNDHNAFRRHKMRHTTKGGHMYKCSYCDYTSIQSTTYRKHLERMHADEASRLLYKCTKCSFVSISELKYQLHQVKHDGPSHGTVEGELGEEPGPIGDRQDVSMQGDGLLTEDATAQQHHQEDDSRACESVGSDVMIVDSREPVESGATSQTQNSPCPVVQQQQHQQQPIIRPAIFANNFSKVDNFYGHHQHQHHQPQQLLQPKILKLTDRIPSHRVSPLGQLQMHRQNLPLTSATFSSPVGTAVHAPLTVSSAELAGVDFHYDVQDQQQQYGEHQQQTFANAMDDTTVLGSDS